MDERARESARLAEAGLDLFGADVRRGREARMDDRGRERGQGLMDLKDWAAKPNTVGPNAGGSIGPERLAIERGPVREAQNLAARAANEVSAQKSAELHEQAAAKREEKFAEQAAARVAAAKARK